MSKVDYSVHPGNPAAQPFNGKGRPNQTKKHSWWNPKSDSFWRNKKKKNTKEGSEKEDANKKPRRFKKNADEE